MYISNVFNDAWMYLSICMYDETKMDVYLNGIGQNINMEMGAFNFDYSELEIGVRDGMGVYDHETWENGHLQDKYYEMPRDRDIKYQFFEGKIDELRVY